MRNKAIYPRAAVDRRTYRGAHENAEEADAAHEFEQHQLHPLEERELRRVLEPLEFAHLIQRVAIRVSCAHV